MNLKDFEDELMRQVAAVMGVTYEEMGMARDRSTFTYNTSHGAETIREFYEQASRAWENVRTDPPWENANPKQGQTFTGDGPAGKDARCINPKFTPTEHVLPGVELWQHPDTGTNIKMPNGQYLADRTGARYDLSYDWMNDRESMPADPDEIVNKYARVHHNFIRFFG